MKILKQERQNIDIATKLLLNTIIMVKRMRRLTPITIIVLFLKAIMLH